MTEKRNGTERRKEEEIEEKGGKGKKRGRNRGKKGKGGGGWVGSKFQVTSTIPAHRGKDQPRQRVD
jgi:hypothetical protein